MGLDLLRQIDFHIALTISEHREARDLDRSALARACDLSEEALYRIEHAISPASAASLFRISRCLDITPGRILADFRADPADAIRLKPVGRQDLNDEGSQLVRWVNAMKDDRLRRAFASVVRAAADKYEHH